MHHCYIFVTAVLQIGRQGIGSSRPARSYVGIAFSLVRFRLGFESPPPHILSGAKMVEAYNGTIKTLTDRRERLSAELENINAELEGLEKAIAILSSMNSQTGRGGAQQPRATGRIHPQEVGVYSLISLRWACLWILSQADRVGLSTASITELLVKNGRTSKAGRFASTVSAVLSNMKIKEEVEQTGNYWVLTALGQAALAAIQPRLDVLAAEHLKYGKDDIDYAAACDYYYGGASGPSTPRSY
jgi:hypothetical protein